jgi:hypothetical protein
LLDKSDNCCMLGMAGTELRVTTLNPSIPPSRSPIRCYYCIYNKNCVLIFLYYTYCCYYILVKELCNFMVV